MPAHGQTVLINNPNIFPKLAKVLDLIFKKTKKGAILQDGFSSSINEFRKSILVYGPLGKNSAGIINECLLNHRFNEAAKLLWVMCQDRSCFDLILYKGIMVVLDNLIPSDEIETFKTVTRDIKKLTYINKLELQLEYLIYALKKDTSGEEDSYYLEGKNARKRRRRIIPRVEQIYSAYIALLSYISWARNISQVPSDEQSAQTNKEFAFTIIPSFKQLVYTPGIWDVFVLKLIEMLEYYEQYDELGEILMKNIEINPKHVNAYVYFCVHLHKHNSNPEIFIQYAKILSDLCPSDERVILLVQKWDELGINLKKCLKILFAFLDYPVNGHILLAWELLSMHFYKAIRSKDARSMELINSSWNLRKNSWNYMHFRLSNINTDVFKLIKWKMEILCIVQPDHEYIENVKEKLAGEKKDFLQNGNTSPLSKDFSPLYKLNDSTSFS